MSKKIDEEIKKIEMKKANAKKIIEEKSKEIASLDIKLKPLMKLKKKQDSIDQEIENILNNTEIAD